MTRSECQSWIDHWHHRCQRYQFYCLIHKHGLDKATEEMKPKIRSCHLDKFQQFNAFHLIPYISITSYPNYEECKQKLHEAIKKLRKYKKLIYKCKD